MLTIGLKAHISKHSIGSLAVLITECSELLQCGKCIELCEQRQFVLLGLIRWDNCASLINQHEP